MISDAPAIVYGKNDKDGKKKHSKREMDDLVKRWNEKKEREKKGKKMNLNDFLRNAEETKQ